MDLRNIGVPSDIYYQILWYANLEKHDMKQVLDSMGPIQIKSKEWLVDTLAATVSKEIKRVQLYGGWNGYPLIDLLEEIYDIEFLFNIDIDENSNKLFKKYCKLKNKHKDKFKFLNQDVKVPYKKDGSTDLIINCSSEHMENFPELIRNKNYKGGTIAALQSNNMFHIEDHINCCNSEDEFLEKTEIKDVLYKGTLKLSNGYERYMIIGSI